MGNFFQKPISDWDLIQSINHNDLKKLEYLVHKSSKFVTSPFTSPLYYAVASNRYNAVKILLEGGFDPNDVLFFRAEQTLKFPGYTSQVSCNLLFLTIQLSEKIPTMLLIAKLLIEKGINLAHQMELWDVENKKMIKIDAWEYAKQIQNDKASQLLASYFFETKVAFIAALKLA